MIEVVGVIACGTLALFMLVTGVLARRRRRRYKKDEDKGQRQLDWEQRMHGDRQYVVGGVREGKEE
jgi:hypothetical protein